MPGPRACTNKKKKDLFTSDGPNVPYEEGRLVFSNAPTMDLMVFHSSPPSRRSGFSLNNHNKVSRIYGGQTCRICLRNPPEPATRAPQWRDEGNDR